MGGYTFAQWSIDLRYAIAGFLVDGLVGVTGVGGGSLMTPILIVLFGVPPGTAVGTDLLFAAITKTGGSFAHGFNGTIEWRVVRRLATGSVPASSLSLVASVGAVLGVLVTFSSVSAGSIGAMALVLLYPRIPAVRIVGSDIAHAVPLTLIAGLGHWCNGVCPSCCAFVAAGWIIARHPHRQLDFRTCSRIWSSLRPGDSADYRWKQIGARCFRWMKSRHWTSIE